MRKIKILGRTYKVVPTINKNLGLYGMCDYKKQEIHISKALCPERKFEVLLHEIVHAIDGDMKIGMKEAQVYRLAAGLAGVALENPRLFKGE